MQLHMSEAQISSNHNYIIPYTNCTQQQQQQNQQPDFSRLLHDTIKQNDDQSTGNHKTKKMQLIQGFEGIRNQVQIGEFEASQEYFNNPRMGNSPVVRNYNSEIIGRINSNDNDFKNTGNIPLMRNYSETIRRTNSNENDYKNVGSAPLMQNYSDIINKSNTNLNNFQKNYDFTIMNNKFSDNFKPSYNLGEDVIIGAHTNYDAIPNLVKSEISKSIFHLQIQITSHDLSKIILITPRYFPNLKKANVCIHGININDSQKPEDNEESKNFVVELTEPLHFRGLQIQQKLEKNKRGYQNITFKGDFNASISECEFDGIGLAFQQNKSLKTITTSKFSNISKQAILLVECEQMKIKEIMIQNCESGLTSIQCNNIIMSNVVVQNCARDGVCFVLTENGLICQSEISKCEGNGVVFLKSNCVFNMSNVFNCGKGIVLWKSEVVYDSLVYRDNWIQNVEIDQLSEWMEAKQIHESFSLNS